MANRSLKNRNDSKIKEALRTLDNFTKHFQVDPSQKPQLSLLKKLRNLFRSKPKVEHKELLHAIAVLSGKAELGSAEQRVIERFNTLLDQMQQQRRAYVSKRVGNFLNDHDELWHHELPKVVLKAHAIKLTPQAGPKTHKVDQVGLTCVTPFNELPHLSPQGRDLFYMKAISLIQGELQLSHADARQLIREAILQCKLHPDRLTYTATHPYFTVAITFRKPHYLDAFAIHKHC